MNVRDWFIDNKCQLIFVKIKLNAFFYAEKKKLPEFNIIYDYSKIKQYHTVEYLDSCLDANLVENAWQ